MKENKPLIFINSAQSNEINDKNQYVYDSRYNKPFKIKKVIKKEVIDESEQEDVENNDDINEEDEIIYQTNNEMNETEEVLIDKKLLNKIELLDKRGKLGRYVLVSVETGTESFEGYFIEKTDNEIIIREEEQDINVTINEIKELLILKV